MNEANLKRLMRLVSRTGDTLVVTDSHGDEPIVLMPIARYEAMSDPLGAFEEDGLDYEDQFDPTEVAEQIGGFDPYSPIMSEPETVAVGEDETVDDELTEEEMVKIDQEVAAELSNVPVAQAEREKAPTSATNGEERFYLEPIE